MPIVKKIGPANYHASIKETKGLTGVVLVFHPQCGHCVQMRPEWEKMKRNVPRHVRIVEIDASKMAESPELSRSEVGKHTEGYPTILSLKDGRVTGNFRDQRVAPKMARFVIQTNKKRTLKNKPKRKNRTGKR